MKHLSKLILLLILASITAEAQTGKKKPNKNATKATTITTKSVRGAASPDELGKYVFEALQNNRFESIEHFFPSEADLNSTEKRTPDEDLQVVLEDHSIDDLKSSFRADFEALQNKSLEQKVSFQEINLMEVEAGAPRKANRVIPVNLLLSDRSNQTMALVFEALKINGRYFLFQHIKVKE